MRLIDADACREDFMQEVYAELESDPDNTRANRIIDLFDMMPTVKPRPDWTPCAEGQNLPENKKEALLSCVGDNKREYVCKGYYIGKHTEEIGAADDIEADWDEETDTNFLPEGFYECIENWGDYSFVYINDTVIAWQPLPDPYNPDRKEDADHIVDVNKKIEED